MGKDQWIGATPCSYASTVDYVILSHECFLLVKKFEVRIQRFEPALSGKHSPVCFTFVAGGERRKN